MSTAALAVERSASNCTCWQYCPTAMSGGHHERTMFHAGATVADNYLTHFAWELVRHEHVRVAELPFEWCQRCWPLASVTASVVKYLLLRELLRSAPRSFRFFLFFGRPFKALRYVPSLLGGVYVGTLFRRRMKVDISARD